MKKVKGHVSGDFIFMEDMDCSELTGIGGSAYFRGATVPEELRNVKVGNTDCPAKDNARKSLAASFIKAGYLFADGILSKIIGKRISGSVTIWSVTVCGKVESSVVIEKDGVYSHGKTLKEARASFIFKITDRDTKKYESWSLDTVVSAAEAIASYRAITGACEFGTREFCKKNNIDLGGNFTPKKIIEITEGSYGSQQYKSFFEKV